MAKTVEPREVNDTRELQKFKIAQMQSAIATTCRNPDSDQLAEAGDIDNPSDFLRTWEVLEKSILRTKKILCSRTFKDLERIISLEPSTVNSELAAGEVVLADIDEELAMKKLQAKQKQQSGNRERSELHGLIISKLGRRSDPISVKVTVFLTLGRRLYVSSIISVDAIICLG